MRPTADGADRRRRYRSIRSRPKGAVTPFVTDIMNATGLAFNMTGELFVSSRYRRQRLSRRSDRDARELFTEGMGIATRHRLRPRRQSLCRRPQRQHFQNQPRAKRFSSLRRSNPALRPTIWPLASTIISMSRAQRHRVSIRSTGFRRTAKWNVSSPDWAVRRAWRSISKAMFTVVGFISRPARDFPHSAIRSKPELVVAGLSLVGLAFDFEENLMVRLIADRLALSGPAWHHGKAVFPELMLSAEIIAIGSELLTPRFHGHEFALSHRQLNEHRHSGRDEVDRRRR